MLISYGLKQALRAWFEKFRKTLLLAGFQQRQHYPSLFLRHTSNGVTILLLYVDDIIIFGTVTDGNLVARGP